MSKINDVKEYVEKLDEAKKVNPKDLSSDQDLTIAVMNLISIEEHLMFSGAKTGKTSYYKLIEQIRETRKNLMQKLIPTYEGEVWCISKHLLATAMRIMEVGTKQQSLGNDKEAYGLFEKSYEMYCLFWGLNMNMIDIKDVKWIEDKKEDIQNIVEKIEKNKKNDLKNTVEELKEDKKEENKKKTEILVETTSGNKITDKLKNFVKKAVNCCIE